jgi:hypothetical protein
MVLRTDAEPPYFYQTALVRWRAAAHGFDDWSLDGAQPGVDGALQLDPAAPRSDSDPYSPGLYLGRSYYNGSSFIVGEALSPMADAPFAFYDAVVSWNAETPDGTWLEVQLRIRAEDRWSRWYSLGVWASSFTAVERHSVGDQDDDDASVGVDTLTAKRPALGYQVRLRLFSASKTLTPRVHATGVALSTKNHYTATPAPGDPVLWDRILPVPARSQMLFPGGGNVWCGPVSLSMVQAYWRALPGLVHGDEPAGPTPEEVHAAVSGTYDWCYDGHGNWAFNVAYAALGGLEAYAARLPSLAAAERWIAAGVPLVLSYRWQPGELRGAPLASSNGHLGVLVGFDAAGNPVLNDPAAPDDAAVRRTYLRAELEAIWQQGSGGLCYLIYPPGWETPDLSP